MDLWSSTHVKGPRITRPRGGQPMRRLWLLIAAAAGLTGTGRVDEPARKYQVVTPREDGIVATGINGRGEVVGFAWRESTEQPGILEQRPFLARGKEIADLPLLKGYTATFP